MGSNNIKDLRSSHSIAHTGIPDRLQKIEALRFVRIKKGKKQPFERKWESERNYAANEPRLQGHLAASGNYGIVCGFGGLAVFDSDEEDRLQELGVLDKLPRTFTVRTGGGGSHRYYFCPELGQKIILYDPVLKDPEHPHNSLHLGEIQWKGQQVVGPGSIHPNGQKYEVMVDSDIAEISLADLLDAIKELKTSKKKKTTKCPCKEGKGKGKRISGKLSAFNNIIKIQDIAMPKDVVSNDGIEIQGSHPIHDSTSGKNFSINPKKNTWHCWRHETGGGPFEWIAVKEGLISCAEAGPRCLRGRSFKKVLDIARDLGYDIPDLKQSSSQVRIIEKRIVVDELPDNLPPEPIDVIKGPPRIGKTHWATEQLIKTGSGVYVSHNHSIIEHAFKIFKKNGGKSAVWLKGKSREGMCRKVGQECKECELYPNQHDKNHISYIELKGRSEELLSAYGTLTEKEIPLDLCPYYTLKLAEESAQFCFTVPHFLEKIQPRSLVILDEDTTLSYFYPPSVELFKFKKNKNENNFVNSLNKAMEQAQIVKNRIDAKDKQNDADRSQIWSINQLDKINNIINSTMSGNSDPLQCYNELSSQISKECEIGYDDNERAFRSIEDHSILDRSSEVDIRDYITSMLCAYKKRPLHIISSGTSGYKTVYLIGDATKPVLHLSWIRKQEQKIILIGNTLAELFGQSLGDAVVIEIPKFKYIQNYVVIAIDSGGEKAYDGQMKKQRLKIRKLIKAIGGTADISLRHPLMVLTGSKEHQEALTRQIGGIAHGSREEGEIGQKWNYQAGNVNVFYQNSTISRGLDLDQYGVILVHDADFSQPFWSAAKEIGEERADEILDSIIIDETTNSVLRISPVVGGDELKPKIVVVPRNDLWKIRYLDGQVLGQAQGGRSADIEDISALIVESNLAGTIRLEDNRTQQDIELKGGDWREAVKDGKLVDLFRLRLYEVAGRDKYTEEELHQAMEEILQVFRSAEKLSRQMVKLSTKQLRKHGLKCRNAVLRPALNKLYYLGKIRRQWQPSSRQDYYFLAPTMI